MKVGNFWSERGLEAYAQDLLGREVGTGGSHGRFVIFLQANRW